MSMTNIYEIINSLAFTDKEKTTLRSYFYKNSNEIDKALSIIDTCQMPEAKLDFIKKTFLKTVQKLKVAEAFPTGLPYKKPIPLLSSTGSQWDYQLDEDLREMLQGTIKKHYQKFKENVRDKTEIPFYFFVSGPGTGKSRNATELHQTALKIISDPELKSRLEKAWVFYVSLENGHSLRPIEKDSYVAIATRMLFQLLEERLDTVIARYELTSPWDVLNLVAIYENKELESATFILVIDGMQNMIESKDDGLYKESKFYKTLTTIGELSLENIFCITCCTMTTTGPIEFFLAESSRYRVFLPVSPLKPPTIASNPVFEIDNSIIRLLVGDCGGHGRELEVLQQTLTNNNNIKNSNFMENFHNQLKYRYKRAFSYDANDAKEIVRAVLTHTTLSNYRPITNRTKLTPDEITRTGMFHFEKMGNSDEGYLVMPYMWLWVMAEQFLDERAPDLQYWRFDDYQEHLSKEDKCLASGYCTWQNFEIFNANFRCLKSRMIDEGEIVSISDIHRGAKLNCDIKYKNHHLHLDISSRKIDTRTTQTNSKRWYIECEHNTIDIRECTHCIINKTSAPHGDALIGLDLPDSKNEVQQYKLLNDHSTFNYIVERNKAASKKDFFILITTKDLDIELPQNSGIVNKQNWNQYFGAFSGRAFIFAVEGPPDINNAVRAQLQLVSQVGKKRAEEIMAKRPFKNIQDAKQKTNIPEKILKRFKY
ncbi:8373_t:CDS:2 [Funneliformis caledonium]|uniref:8373_t:CDS:1 n=1 Tax=Funneliformis caledonium TaxID=1117310 RepID=A0A9N8VBX5_9GLOM|nr:8373_t:CDS:2 [Funneliformis caledonium]